MDSKPGSPNIFSITISIVFGIVIGILLYGFYKPPVLLRGPNSKDIVDKKFTYLGKTYVLEPRVCAYPRGWR